MVDGRRITDKATLDVVTMVYAGLVNKNLYLPDFRQKVLMHLDLQGRYECDKSARRPKRY